MAGDIDKFHRGRFSKLFSQVFTKPIEHSESYEYFRAYRELYSNPESCSTFLGRVAGLKRLIEEFRLALNLGFVYVEYTYGDIGLYDLADLKSISVKAEITALLGSMKNGEILPAIFFDNKEIGDLVDDVFRAIDDSDNRGLLLAEAYSDENYHGLPLEYPSDDYNLQGFLEMVKDSMRPNTQRIPHFALQAYYRHKGKTRRLTVLNPIKHNGKPALLGYLDQNLLQPVLKHHRMY